MAAVIRLGEGMGGDFCVSARGRLCYIYIFHFACTGFFSCTSENPKEIRGTRLKKMQRYYPKVPTRLFNISFPLSQNRD